MQDIQALIEYFSVSRPLLVIGAGPSCDIGLPTWKKLAEDLVNHLRLDPTLSVEPSEESFARADYSAVFGTAIKATSENFVYEFCRAQLADPGTTGRQYSLLSRLPVRGFITTNFDSILLRHLNAHGKAAVEFSNRPEDLSSIDFDTIPSILKIHGDFSSTDFLVLTDQQYREVLHSGRFLGLREFVKAYLRTSRIVFVGYSVTDPDFTYLLEATAQTLRRRTPLFGILANATQVQIGNYFDRFNLQVISYAATGKRPL